ncbi:hypothetical protein M426DRAFT_324409 [Hypoxylon sp. CI-4A]|nr:hypothetical protein M426DRAFT_324409 [Hypoxylon sp. CI-4A]
MRVQCAFFPLLGGALVNIASAAIRDIRDAPPAAPVVPGAYIVELDDNHDVDSFYNDLSASNVEADPRLDLSSSLFKGCSFRLRNASNDDADVAALKISSMPKVRKLWPIRIHNRPNDEIVWTGDAKSPSLSLKKRQEPGNDTFTPHVMTQIDKLRAEGITGAGVKIGIVDTGVDYNHPALGNGCFGPGCLFSYGTDLVGDDYTGANAPVPDADPYDNCAGHGTHVSGIIAAQTNEMGFTGAAPDVTLGMYRVFGCQGGSSDDVLIAAFNQAYEDGSDIITASIGGPSGWSEDPWAVVAQRIVEAGVIVTAAAGNDGSNGLFYASSAANGKKVTAVASVENTEIPLLLVSASFAVDNATSEAFGWQAGNPEYANISLPLWAVSNNTDIEDDACNPLPDGTPDLSGYLVLVREANCGFDVSAQNVADKGAKYIIFYSNVPTTAQAYIYVEEILGAGMVTDKQGAEWVGLLNEGKEIIVDITDQISTGKIVELAENTPYGGLVSSFSSWGPTWEVEVKPQLATPGGDILSTWPLDLGGYSVLSGTSMATPLAAAIYALVSQARGTLDPSTLERVLSATAIAKVWAEDTSGRLAPVPQQGGGLVQVYDAAHTNTLLSVSSISFNDTDNFIPSANFSIENLGPDEVTYEIGHVEAVTMYTWKEGQADGYPAYYPNPIANETATLEFSTTKITIPAGGSADVTVTPTPPSGLDEARLPVYSGYITINSTSGNALSIPYLGVVGSMFSAPTMLDPDWTFLSNYTNTLERAAGNQTFTIPFPTNSTSDPDSSIGYPTAVIQLQFGTPLLRCDVVPLDNTTDIATTDVLGVEVLGSVLNFPVEYSQRNYYISPFTGLLTDGVAVPEGRYQFLVRVLRVFGDPEKAEDYDSVALQPFSIKYV